jgi:putative transposase
MTKLKHYDNLGTARFVTFCCWRQQKYLIDLLAKRLLIKNIDQARNKFGFKLLGYVIMPEHVHLVILPSDHSKLGLIIREIKSKMAREYFALTMKEIEGTRVFWQRRCYDHNCRSRDSVGEKIKYCHNNPVKRGLVKTAGDYIWSSNNWYEGKRDVPIKIDDYEI